MAAVAQESRQRALVYAAGDFHCALLRASIELRDCGAGHGGIPRTVKGLLARLGLERGAGRAGPRGVSLLPRIGLGVQAATFRALDDKLDSLGLSLHGYSPALDWIARGALAAYFLAAAWRNPEFRVNWRWLGVAIFLFGLFWVIPFQWGDSSDLDIRVLPVLFVAILASVRIGRRGRILAAIPLVLFAAWMTSVTRHFTRQQKELAGLARSFDAVPRNALVFPIVEGDQDPIERPFTHFWAYGVIRRGWYSPYLADIPGQTPMRIIRDLYTSDGFWDLTYDQPPDWAQVQEDYEYVWAYGVSRFSAPLAAIGDRVYSFGALEVYRVRKPPPENPDR